MRYCTQVRIGAIHTQMLGLRDCLFILCLACKHIHPIATCIVYLCMLHVQHTQQTSTSSSIQVLNSVQSPSFTPKHKAVLNVLMSYQSVLCVKLYIHNHANTWKTKVYSYCVKRHELVWNEACKCILLRTQPQASLTSPTHFCKRLSVLASIKQFDKWKAWF